MKNEEKIRVYLFALEELKAQMMESDSPFLRAEYNVIVEKINKWAAEDKTEQKGVVSENIL